MGKLRRGRLFKGGLYDRSAKAFVAVARLMETIGVSAESPAPSPEIEAFLKADAEMRHSGRQAKSRQFTTSLTPLCWPVDHS